MNERDIEAHLVKRVKALGGEVRKVQWVGRRGAPDRIVMLPAAGLDCQMQAGHDRPVFVHNIIARDTVDELVMARIETKREVQDLLLEAKKERK